MMTDRRELFRLMALGSRLLGQDQHADTVDLLVKHFPENPSDDVIESFDEMVKSHAKEIAAARLAE